ncbi:MAG: MBL fold metallo-hydrolase [Anaerolineae bacterium]|nr:MBL fold metallo-hydrolase [Anaerolineae bacterium]
MSTAIEFLGIAAYRITLPDGRVVVIDPCLSANPASPVQPDDLEQVDLLLVTHLAADHLGDASAIARRFGCPVVCGKEVAYFMQQEGVSKAQFRTVPWHGQVNPLGIRVRAVPSMHSSMGLAPDGKWLCGQPMGVILYVDEATRIYHSGDSAIFSDLRLIGELYRPTVGLLCACELEQEYLLSLGLHDHYGNEMSGDEGALAAAWLGVEYALCCHYLNPEGREDVVRFTRALQARAAEPGAPQPVILKAGETFVYPPQR